MNMKCRVSCSGEHITVNTSNLIIALSEGLEALILRGVDVANANSASVVRFNEEEEE